MARTRTRHRAFLRRTRAYPAAEDADFVERRGGVDLGDASCVDDGVFAECGCPDEVVNGLAVLGEPRLSVADHRPAVGVDP